MGAIGAIGATVATGATGAIGAMGAIGATVATVATGQRPEFRFGLVDRSGQRYPISVIELVINPIALDSVFQSWFCCCLCSRFHLLSFPPALA